MIALIDGDILVYECAFAAEYTVYLPKVMADYGHGWRYKKEVPKNADGKFIDVDKVKIVENEDKALAALDGVMKSIISKTKATEIIVYLSEGKNFRHDLMAHLPEEKQYKANRRDTVKPIYYNLMRKTLAEKYSALYIKGFEADDALGIIHTNFNARKITSVICTIDKDLQTIPGFHYNPTKKEFVYIDELKAKRNFCMQVLTGDSTDNIPGIPKVGAVTAKKTLDIAKGDDAKWPALIKGLYEKRIGKGWLKELKLNMALIRILKEPQPKLTIEMLDQPVLVQGLDIFTNPAGDFNESR